MSRRRLGYDTAIMEKESQSLLILSRFAQAYADLIRQAGLALPGMAAFSSPDVPGRICRQAGLVLGEPDLVAPLLPRLTGLQWLQSTWAGVTPLLGEGCRTDYVLTNIRGVFDPIMTEYVICHLLMNEQKSLDRFRSRQERRWDPTPPGRLAGKTLGIMGVGSIGRAVARAAKFFGMRTRGYARRPTHCADIDEGYTGHLPVFVRDLDYLVSILPDTPATEGLLDAEIFSAMKSTALVINVGRGNVMVDNDLAAAVRDGIIGGAVLDVFRQEPLPPDHPFWKTEGILITSHTAALGFPEDIAPVFLDNYRRFRRGKALKYRVDFSQGY